eukprot:1161438-Pelagomonas_calceolata.AAC.8
MQAESRVGSYVKRIYYISSKLMFKCIYARKGYLPHVEKYIAGGALQELGLHSMFCCSPSTLNMLRLKFYCVSPSTPVNPCFPPRAPPRAACCPLLSSPSLIRSHPRLSLPQLQAGPRASASC